MLLCAGKQHDHSLFPILPDPNLKTIGRTCKDPGNCPCSITVDDTLNARIRSRPKKEEPDADDGDVESQHHIAKYGLLVEPLDASIGSSHSNIGDTPKDEPEEGVEEGRHQREKIVEEGDDLGLVVSFC